MNGPRVVATGIGLVSPLACDARKHFERLLAGESAVEALSDESYRNFPPLAQARVHAFDRRQMVPDRMLRKLLSPSPAYALAAATGALNDSGVPAAELAACGLYVGSVCLDVDPETFIPALQQSINKDGAVDLACFAQRGMKLIDPLFLVKSLPNAGLCAIAIQHQVLGPNANVTNGAISGMEAVIAAAQAIRRGDAEIALAGGYDSLLQMDCIADHLLAGRLALRKEPAAASCRPFDRRRDGYALSEGAAFLMLETLDHARNRGARIYGEILAAGQTTSAQTLLDPARNGGAALSEAARQALASSGLKGSDVSVVLGDGLAIPADECREMEAYSSLLEGSGAPFTAFTGSFGFVGAAAGPFSLAHALLALHDGVIPPLTNCEDPVPGCPLPLLKSAYRTAARHALVWTSDRGIKNAALVAASC
jgi:3-oxoacyl-[acyl-carrier-protein] synthase II